MTFFVIRKSLDFFHRKFLILFFTSTAPKGKITTGGDVWVLLIKNTRPSDTDVYICEVNSDPIAKSFHPLKGELRFFFL